MTCKPAWTLTQLRKGFAPRALQLLRHVQSSFSFLRCAVASRCASIFGTTDITNQKTNWKENHHNDENDSDNDHGNSTDNDAAARFNVIQVTARAAEWTRMTTVIVTVSLWLWLWPWPWLLLVPLPLPLPLPLSLRGGAEWMWPFVPKDVPQGLGGYSFALAKVVLKCLEMHKLLLSFTSIPFANWLAFQSQASMLVSL